MLQQLEIDQNTSFTYNIPLLVSIKAHKLPF